MPFNGSGGFNRVRNWQADASAPVKIRADYHDQEDDNLAAGLSSVITKDGQTQPTANLPLNGKRWVNAGDPVNPQDYVTKHWVEVLPGWSTSKYISGSDLDGRLNFSSPTGSNGIGWAAVDMSLLNRVAAANKTSKRLVINSAQSGGGADVFVVDETGRVNLYQGQLTWNLSWDGDEYRTINPGLATLLNLTSGLSLSGLDAATTLDPYKPAPLREFLDVANTAGSVLLNLYKSASAKVAGLVGNMGTARRWLMYLGDATAEASGNVGSDFQLYSYDNDGTTIHPAMTIKRSNRAVTFYGPISFTGSLSITGGLTTTGPITSGGAVTSSQNFDSTSTQCILSATSGGSILFRPNGPTSTVEQMILDTAGGISLTGTGGVTAGAGLKEKAGQTGAYGSQWINFDYVSALHAYVGNTDLGPIFFSCDYRIKQAVQPLGSTWEAVKDLRPITYEMADYGEIFLADGVPRWGFIAHELQETLLPSAANGHKDEENVIQSPDLMAVVAALTRTVQEAQLRIEALEAGG